MPKQLRRYVTDTDQIRNMAILKKRGHNLGQAAENTTFFLVMQTYIVTNKYIKDRTPIECVIDDGEGPSLRVYVLY